MKPKLLDLFCGAGGAAMGYSRAGFDIVGVDIKPQPHYPFPFVQADALEYVAEHGREFDAIHASPPCQGYSIASNVHRNRGKKYPLLIGDVRSALIYAGRPWIIENVKGSPLGGITLCGTMFGLGVFRHRIFEAPFALMQPDHVPHDGKIGDGKYFSVAGGAGRWKSWGTVHRNVSKGTAAQWREAMGIDWMTRDEIKEAIPPAYTEYIGRQLMAYIQAQAKQTERAR